MKKVNLEPVQKNKVFLSNHEMDYVKYFWG